MVLPAEPAHGGFLRPFGAAVFVRDFLMGKGADYGVEAIDPTVGAPQVDIHNAYKTALLRATAEDRAVRWEEAVARKEGRAISPDAIIEWTAFYVKRIPYKRTGSRYHSFVVYFSLLKVLGWVVRTGRTEPSTIQDYYPQAPPRVYYKLTEAGRRATVAQLADPIRTRYGYPPGKRSPKGRRDAEPPVPPGDARRRAPEPGPGRGRPRP